MFDFKLGKKFSITYKQFVAVYGKPKADIVEITLKDLMYHRQTECYFYFWTGKESIRVLKSRLTRAVSLD